MPDFCTHYIALAGRVAGWGEWFIVAAFLVAVVMAIAEVVAALQPKTPPVRGSAPAPTSIKDMIDALKGLIAALATAPLWLALLGAGVLLFWVPGASIPATCAEICKTGQACETDPSNGGSQDNGTAEQNSTVNANQTGNTN